MKLLQSVLELKIVKLSEGACESKMSTIMEEIKEVIQVVSSEELVVEGNNIENITSMDPIFYKAAFEGNMDAFKEKSNEKIETMLTPNKNTILHIHFTSYNVSEPFVDGILNMCPSLLTKPNFKGETLLHIAARYGHDKIVTKLIGIAKNLSETEAETHMLIRAEDNENNTALHEAVRFHQKQIVHILTMEDPHYSYFGNNDGQTPLYIAAERGYRDVVNEILKHCLSPNQDGPNGRTALHAAIICHDQEMVSKLLEKSNSQAKKADENGWIPLHLAAISGSADLTEKLLKCERSTTYMRDKRGRTALHLAARCGNKEVMEKIIEYGPDCAELVDENGFNALHYTAHWGSKWSAKVILKNASLSNLYNEKDYNGNTPLHLLARTHISVWDDHSLLKPHKRVDTMAFNKKNQTAIDVADESLCSTSLPYIQRTHLQRMLRKIGVRRGGRIIMVDQNERKMIKAETHKQDSEPLNILRDINFIVATLITTITFAAGFTLPGGLIQEFDQPEKGSPILKHNFAFQAFVITNSLSFVLSTIAVLRLFISSFIDGIEKEKIIRSTQLLTVYAMQFLIIAFAAGTYAVLGTSSVVVTLFIGLPYFWVVYRLTIRKFRTFMHLYPKPDRIILLAKDIQLSEFESVGSSVYLEP